MGVSHVAGGAVRRVGSSAMDLEPEHRRDGLGFSLLALAVVIAAREWWGVSGTFGDVVHAVVAGTFGRVAYAVPLVLLALGLRLMRAPQDDGTTNRVAVGLVAMTFSACGLAHLDAGIPNPPDGAGPMRAAGGILGFLASSPLAAAVSGYGALVLLVLLGIFGLLVLTATPVTMIPERLRQLRSLVLRHDPEGDHDDETLDPERPAGKPARRARREAVDLSERDGDEAFRQAAQVRADAEAAEAAATAGGPPEAPGRGRSAPPSRVSSHRGPAGARASTRPTPRRTGRRPSPPSGPRPSSSRRR